MGNTDLCSVLLSSAEARAPTVHPHPPILCWRRAGTGPSLPGLLSSLLSSCLAHFFGSCSPPIGEHQPQHNAIVQPPLPSHVCRAHLVRHAPAAPFDLDQMSRHQHLVTSAASNPENLDSRAATQAIERQRFHYSKIRNTPSQRERKENGKSTRTRAQTSAPPSHGPVSLSPARPSWN